MKLKYTFIFTILSFFILTAGFSHAPIDEQNCDQITGSLTAPADNLKLFSTGHFKFETTLTNLTYKWTATLPDNTNYEFSNYQEANLYFQYGAGQYKIKLEVIHPDGCSKTFEKLYNVQFDCNTIQLNGSILNMGSSSNFRDPNVLINTPAHFVFYPYSVFNLDNVTLTWEVIDSNNQSVYSVTAQEFHFSFTTLGTYELRLKIKDNMYGCPFNFSTQIQVVDTCTYTESERYGRINFENEFTTGALEININQSKNLAYRLYNNEEITKLFNYDWTLYGPNSNPISEGKGKIFPITVASGGFHRVILKIEDPQTGCTTTIEKSINVLIPSSCTDTNPKSQIVKGLFLGLVRNLMARSLMGETDEHINNSVPGPDFIALKPYLTNGIKDKIYNYKTTKVANEAGVFDVLTAIDFSFSPDRESDVRVFYERGTNYDPEYDTYEGLLEKIDEAIYFKVGQYIRADTPLISCYVMNASKMTPGSHVKPLPGECYKETIVQYVDFCPAEECTPIVGVLKIVKTTVPPNPNPNPTPLPTTVYNYEGLWLPDNANQPETNAWVEYKDEFGVQKRTIVGAITNGCKEIIASSIVSTNGVDSCSTCQSLPVGRNGSESCYTVTYLNCAGEIQTLFTHPTTIEGKKIITVVEQGCQSTDPPIDPPIETSKTTNTRSKK